MTYPMLQKWKLDGKRVVRCDDMHEWAMWYQTANRRVAQTDIDGLFHVSTVFLGIDHGWGEGDPLFFETMVFSKNETAEDHDCQRYFTWEEAEAGHQAVVEKWTAKAKELQISATSVLQTEVIDGQGNVEGSSRDAQDQAQEPRGGSQDHSA